MLKLKLSHNVRKCPADKHVWLEQADLRQCAVCGCAQRAEWRARWGRMVRVWVNVPRPRRVAR